MEKNVGGTDRTVRVVAGLALLGAAALLSRGTDGGRLRSRWTRLVLAYAGVDLLITSLLQRCPVNSLLGVNTCEQDLGTAAGEAAESVRHAIP